jgi:hypothetical protein
MMILAYKFDLICDTIITNILALTDAAELDFCGNESSWAHNGFWEAGTSLVGRVLNKQGITKGGQVVPLTDAYRWHRYAYVHRHKCQSGYRKWTAAGPVEV